MIGYDESEQLDVQPARYFVRVIKRGKRACRCCQASAVTMPPLAPRIVEKRLASDRVVVEHGGPPVTKICRIPVMTKQSGHRESVKMQSKVGSFAPASEPVCGAS